jgi:low affinity Fe/Cu permease
MINKLEKKPKKKTKFKIVENTQNRLITLICLVSINMVAIFSDVIVGYFTQSAIVDESVTVGNETKNHIVEIEHLEYSGVKELIELQEKHQKLDAKYNSLENKISKLQNKQNSSHIIIYYFKLLNKIKDGKNYEDDLLLTKSLINKDSKLFDNFIKFENLLKNNIKTHQEIQNHFDQLISKIKSYNRIKTNDNLINRIKNNILSQVTIRKINFKNEESNNIDYIIYKIENNLKKEHYQEALDNINKIKHTPPKLLIILKKDLENLIEFQIINKEIIKLFS